MRARLLAPFLSIADRDPFGQRHPQKDRGSGDDNALRTSSSNRKCHVISDESPDKTSGRASARNVVLGFVWGFQRSLFRSQK